jgi:hypothetical protein
MFLGIAKQNGAEDLAFNLRGKTAELQDLENELQRKTTDYNLLLKEDGIAQWFLRSKMNSISAVKERIQQLQDQIDSFQEGLIQMGENSNNQLVMAGDNQESWRDE